MYIPNSIRVGDRVRLTQNVEVLSGIFTKGHELVVTGVSYRGYDMIDDEGNKLLECGVVNPNCLEKI